MSIIISTPDVPGSDWPTQWRAVAYGPTLYLKDLVDQYANGPNLRKLSHKVSEWRELECNKVALFALQPEGDGEHGDRRDWLGYMTNPGLTINRVEYVEIAAKPRGIRLPESLYFSSGYGSQALTDAAKKRLSEVYENQILQALIDGDVIAMARRDGESEMLNKLLDECLEMSGRIASLHSAIGKMVKQVPAA